jgi:hypothetical protein
VTQRTENVHESEAIVEGHAHEESREGEQSETVRVGGDDSGHGTDQVAHDQRRNAAQPVGQETQKNSTEDASAEEECLGQWRLAGLVAYPVVLS